LRHPEYPWIGATLDGIADTSEGRAVVESKNIGQYNAKEWADDEPPLRVMVQIQHQMFVSETDIGYAVACIGGRKLEWRKVYRNARFLDALIPKLEEFWEHVQNRTPPEVDSSLATAKVLSKLHPTDSGEVIALPPDADEWAAKLAEAKAAKKVAEELESLYSNHLRAAIGDATFGVTPGGSFFSWRTQEEFHQAKEARIVTRRVLRSIKCLPKGA
jgi:predicted phage-related endonuclease